MLLPAASSTYAAAMASLRLRVGGRSISVVASLGIRSSPCYPQNNSPTSLLGRRQHPLVVPSSLSPFSMTPLAAFMSSAIADGASKPMIHSTIESIRTFRKTINNSTSVGFVPTMGALHEGHLSLVREARANNDVVIASIFVNPAQFGKGEDMDRYPRQLEKDSELLKEVGVDHIFAPSSDLMYGKNHVTFVEPMGFGETNEGKSRPGFFRGVATVVTKLFNIVQPTNAYFGQKDAVQCVLIRRIVEDLDMDVNVKIMDTVRESDGLAMSSRNAYLTQEEREKAPVVYQSLCAAREVYDARFARGMDEVEADDLREVVESVLETEPMIKNVQYVSVDDLETMKPLDKVGNDGCVVSLACVLGSVRLIDNIVLR